jgi:predicted nucleotidyltransferase
VAPTTLLAERDATRRARRLEIYDETRRRLRSALADLVPGARIIVFGSLVKRGVFNDRSDIDLALEREPSSVSLFQLMSELSERLGRPVDVVLLDRCRFRDRILREGESWIA